MKKFLYQLDYLLFILGTVFIVTPMRLFNRLKMRYHKPKFKVNDYIVFSLSYSVTMYRIANINKSGKTSYYELEGVKELEVLDNGANPFRTETKGYKPFCAYADTTARLATKAEVALYGKT